MYEDSLIILSNNSLQIFQIFIRLEIFLQIFKRLTIVVINILILNITNLYCTNSFSMISYQLMTQPQTV